MPRPFTRRQSLQNARFLEALAQTGNARLAAQSLGVHRSTYTKRRSKDAAFAARWESALAPPGAIGNRAQKAANPPPSAQRAENRW
ncbi:MAG TPA: hypothetical protein VGR19_04910 [Allosphingosinicella sp.]|nr:hypothetical protein [Allosphingosinicella sp.]